MLYEIWKRVLGHPISTAIVLTVFTVLASLAVAALTLPRAVIVIVILGLTAIIASLLIALIQYRLTSPLERAEHLISNDKEAKAEKVLSEYLDSAKGEELDKARFRLAQLVGKSRDFERQRELLDSIDKDEYEWGWMVYDRLAINEKNINREPYPERSAKFYESSFNHRRDYQIKHDAHDSRLCTLIRENAQHNRNAEQAYIWFHREMSVSELRLHVGDQRRLENYIRSGDEHRAAYEPNLALTEYTKALLLIEEKLSRNHYQYGLVSEKCAAVCLKDLIPPEIAKAATYLESALDVRRMYLGKTLVESHTDRPYYAFLQKYKARNLVGEAVKILKADHETLLSNLREWDLQVIRDNSYSVGNLVKALVPLVSEIWGSDSEELLKLHEIAGSAYKWRRSQNSDFENAKYHYGEVVRIFNSLPSPTNDITRSVVVAMIDLGGVYYMTKDFSKAYDWRCEAYELAQSMPYEPGIPPSKIGIQLRAEIALYGSLFTLGSTGKINVTNFDEAKTYLENEGIGGEIKTWDKKTISKARGWSELKITTNAGKKFTTVVSG